jgi:hypothetical protein
VWFGSSPSCEKELPRRSRVFTVVSKTIGEKAVVVHLRRRRAAKVELTQDQHTVQIAVTMPVEKTRKKRKTAKQQARHK